MNALHARLTAVVRASGTPSVWLLVGVLAAAATVLTLRLADLGPVFTGPRLPWWALALLFFLAEAFPVHLHFRTETHTLSLSELAVVLGLFLSTPTGLVAGIALGSALALLLVRRQRPLKAAFNVAQFALSVCVAVLVFRPIVSLGDPHRALGWAAAAGGAVAFGLVSVLLVTLTIAIASGGLHLAELPRTVTLALTGSLASASLAIIAVELVEADRQSVWLLAVPVGFWAFAFRAYGQQRQRHEHLEFLYRTMRATQSAPEFRAAVRELLVAALELHAAEYAEIILLGGTSSEGMLRSVITNSHEDLLRPIGVASSATESAIRRADEHDRAILLARGRAPHDLDPFACERGLADALLIALRREQTAAALLVIGNRAGDVSTFGADDQRLFETFAAHASVLLENDQVKEQLRYQAYHDALTGLPNRALFAERVSRALAAESEGTTVLFVDLDDFKTINDTLGHSAGDDLLAAVAERVRACMRGDDLAARLGGDEFGVLLRHHSWERDEVAQQSASRLVEALRAPFVMNGREIQVRASVGIAHASNAHTADELLSNADVAMYSAKADGKERYALYKPEMHTRVRRRHELSAALERALEHGEFIVHYQPIVDLADSRTVAFEALVRWRHPERGLLLPGSFMQLADEMRLTPTLGRFVLREACAQVVAWQSAYPEQGALAICVNLSPTELQQERLPEQVEAVLIGTGLDPSSLILEMTESGAMADPTTTLRVLSRLQRTGVRIALDDFGTGHSSLSHLRTFPIDILKVAKPFVDRLDSDPDDFAFIDAILRLANALQLTIVAEGIERPEQANVLRRLGCALAQGYHFARPLDADAAEHHLAQFRARRRRLSRIRAA